MKKNHKIHSFYTKNLNNFDENLYLNRGELPLIKVQKTEQIIDEYCIDCGAILDFVDDKYTNNQLITELFEKFVCPKCGYEYEFTCKITKNH